MRRRLGDRGTAGSPLRLLHVVVSEPESLTGILNLVAQDGLRDVVVHVQQDLGYGPFDGPTEADCSGDDVVGALCGHTPTAATTAATAATVQGRPWTLVQAGGPPKSRALLASPLCGLTTHRRGQSYNSGRRESPTARPRRWS